MHAVVTAGSKPSPNEPLYAQTQGAYKAFLSLAGKPMIQWVLDAINQSPLIESVVVVGLPPFTDLQSARPLTILEDQGGLLPNLRAGIAAVAARYPESNYSLLFTSDVPTITGEMIDWIANCMAESQVDFLYPVISRQVMEKRFPGSKRTYMHLKDVEVCGGDVMAVRNAAAMQDNANWQKIIDTRKNPIRQASILGIDTLFMILLRQYALAEAGEALGKRLGLHARAVLCPYAEIGMDVDKPHQLQLVEADLNRQRSL